MKTSSVSHISYVPKQTFFFPPPLIHSANPNNQRMWIKHYVPWTWSNEDMELDQSLLYFLKKLPLFFFSSTPPTLLLLLLLLHTSCSGHSWKAINKAQQCLLYGMREALNKSAAIIIQTSVCVCKCVSQGVWLLLL